jgi:hypothetical protein
MGKKNKSIWDTIISSGIFGLIVSVAIVVLQNQNNEFLQFQQQEHEKYLAELQKAHEDTTLKREQKFASQLAKLQNTLDTERDLRGIRESIKEDLDKIEKQLEANIKENEKLVDQKFKELLNQEKLDFISDQLSQFYWPILYRLEKNNSVYHMLDNSFVGDKIDEEVVLPNHLEILKIIEEKIHLAQPDDALKNEINKYIAHVNMYQMLRKGDYKGYPEDYDGEDYNHKLYLKIKARTDFLQSKYELLLDSSELIIDIPSSTINQAFDSLLVAYEQSPNSKKEFNPKKLDYSVEYKEIKLSKTKNSFLISIAHDSTQFDSLAIAFEEYIPESEFCIIEIGPKAKVKNEKGTHFHLRKGEPLSYNDYGKYHYKISLQEIWTQKEWKYVVKINRTVSSLKIERWLKNSPDKNQVGERVTSITP